MLTVRYGPPQGPQGLWQIGIEQALDRASRVSIGSAACAPERHDKRIDDRRIGSLRMCRFNRCRGSRVASRRTWIRPERLGRLRQRRAGICQGHYLTRCIPGMGRRRIRHRRRRCCGSLDVGTSQRRQDRQDTERRGRKSGRGVTQTRVHDFTIKMVWSRNGEDGRLRPIRNAPTQAIGSISDSASSPQNQSQRRAIPNVDMRQLQHYR